MTEFQEQKAQAEFEDAARAVATFEDDTRDSGETYELHEMALALVEEAHRRGCNIAIENRPLTPLMMGNHNAVVLIYPLLKLVREGKV